MNEALGQFEMFGRAVTNAYPDRPGHRGVITSAEAAAAIRPSLGRLQQLTFETISAASWHGCTANELARITGLPRETIQPRTSELRKQGKIADSGRRRENPNGKRAIVWTLPEFRRPVE